MYKLVHNTNTYFQFNPNDVNEKENGDKEYHISSEVKN